MMDQILEHCEGAIGIADDVYGKDDEEHNWNLHRFMHIVHEHGPVFSGEKCEVKQDSVTFFSIVYDTDGAHPDPKKVDAVHQMPPPENPSQMHRFLGMVTYLSPFIPSLSTHTTPLQELLKKESKFTRNTFYQEAFNRMKELICKDTTLCYFDVQKPVTIQVDASGNRLRAALLQEGHLVAFASKAFVPTDQ